MKKALFYAIVKKPYFSGYRIVEVTSERGARWWGRNADATTTHGRTSGLYGRFDSNAAAKAKIATIEEIGRRYSEKLRANQQEAMRLHADREKEIAEAVA